MPTARDIMTPDPAFVRSGETVHTAAERMAELGVGALPVCGEDGRLRGMITDRDVVVKVIGAHRDPRSIDAGELAQGEAVTVGTDDEVEDILATMTNHQVRRLPVMDGDDLVGIVALADVARALPDPKVGDLVHALAMDY